MKQFNILEALTRAKSNCTTEESESKIHHYFVVSLFQ